MLEGTDLYSAYAPLIPVEQPKMASAAPVREREPEEEMPKSVPKAVLPVPQSPQMQPQPQYNPNEFNSQFNQYYDNEQKMLAIISELQKRNTTQSATSQKNSAAVTSAGPSYFDRLASKKKDLVKFLHSALIIIFALSVHFLIHHYFGWYLSNNDVSFERELILRLLYPIGILFIGWNIMLIFK